METAPANDRGSIALQLQLELEDILTVQDVSFGRYGSTVMFTGQLLKDAEAAFALLRRRFQKYGYIPLFRRKRGLDVILAALAPLEVKRSPPIINVVLLLVTILTTLFAGAVQQGYNPLRDASKLTIGIPFSFALLAILGTHELGHYWLARRHGVEVTLPYFIPVPFGLGTFGAFIKMRSPVENRKALFDVGIAGPLVGLAVAFPLLLIGLKLSPLAPLARGTVLGSSILLRLIVRAVVGSMPRGFGLTLHPFALAGWIGMLVTSFNLLPAGQLDGGHIAYAMSGRAYLVISSLTFVALLVMGSTLWSGWLTWALLILFTGTRHPAPLNDITPLDGKRMTAGALSCLLLLLIITPVPFRLYP